MSRLVTVSMAPSSSPGPFEKRWLRSNMSSTNGLSTKINYNSWCILIVDKSLIVFSARKAFLIFSNEITE